MGDLRENPHCRGYVQDPRPLVAFFIAFVLLTSVQSLTVVVGQATGGTKSTSLQNPATSQGTARYDPVLALDSAPSSPGSKLGPSNGGPLGNGSAPTWTFLTTADFGYVDSECVPGGTALTFDAADDYVLGYGGYSPCSSWIGGSFFENGTWTNLPYNATAPTGSTFSSMAYDGADGYVLLYGGQLNNCQGEGPGVCNETWEYRDGVWTLLDPRCYYLGEGFGSCSALPATNGAPMVYDAATGYVLLDTGNGTQITSQGDYGPWAYGNDTWTYLGKNFSTGEIFPSPLSTNMAFDPSDGYVVAFGGEATSASHLGGQGSNYTWKWSGGVWSNISSNVTNAPPPRIITGMVGDTSHGDLLLYGGQNFNCSKYFYDGTCVEADGYGNFTQYDDTWTYSDGAWSQLHPVSNPGYGLSAPQLIDDPSAEGVIEYSFASCTLANCSGATSLEGTWSWGTLPPISNLSVVTAGVVNVGATLNFTAAFNGGVASATVQWEFGDGQTASGSKVSHAYSESGNYTTRVWVNDSLAHANASFKVVVYSNGAFAFASPNPTDVGLETLFYLGILGDSPQFTINWTFGDGQQVGYICTLYCDRLLANHTYASAGAYEVVVSIEYYDGAVVNESFPITVSTDPSTFTLAATPNPAMIGELVNFSAPWTGGTPPYTYSWAFGDGGTGGDLSNITHIFTTNGPFETVVTVHDAAGWERHATVNITITLSASVNASASIGAAPLDTLFTCDVQGGIPGYTYSWQFGDNGTSSNPDPNHVYQAPGNYTASLVVTDVAGHTATAHWALQVFPGGGPLALSIRASRTSMILGETTNLTLLPSGGTGAYTAAWTSIPAGCKPTVSLSLACTPTQNGTYTISGEVRDTSGFSATAGLSFTVGSALHSPPPSGRIQNSSGLFGFPGQDGYYLILAIILAMAFVLGIVTGRRPTVSVESISKTNSIRRPYSEYSLPESSPSPMEPIVGDNGSAVTSPPHETGDRKEESDPLRDMV
jgi:PKD repeat protein